MFLHLQEGDPQKIDDKKTAMKGMLASLKGEIKNYGNIKRNNV